MTDKEKFRLYLSRKDLTIEKFCEIHPHIKKGSLKNYIYDRVNSGYSLIKDLMKACPDLNVYWWLADEGDESNMFRTPNNQELNDPITPYLSQEDYRIITTSLAHLKEEIELLKKNQLKQKD